MKSRLTPFDTCTTSNGPKVLGAGSPSRSARKVAEDFLSRLATIVWFNSTAMTRKYAVVPVSPRPFRQSVAGQRPRALPRMACVRLDLVKATPRQNGTAAKGGGPKAHG